MTWKFLNTGFRTGFFNMELDKYLAVQFHKITGTPILRVYGWQPFAVSIGYNQSMEDFNLSSISSAHYEIVRRPTGGKAIFHAHELTYSVVAPIAIMSPRAWYQFIHERLLHGLEYLGVHADLSESDPNFRELYRDPASIPCFSSSAKSEIQWNGRKLVGSAQRRFGNVILQHGSILLGPEHRQITEFLNTQTPEAKDSIASSLQEHTIDVETILGRSVSFGETAEAVRRGFHEHAGSSIEEITIDDVNISSTILSHEGVL
ncbi:MAG TPA: hypothetical protein VKI62_09375 [Bacteroidota bacterium]|nr:hypothetical protein [Bacteroidota bacterium]